MTDAERLRAVIEASGMSARRFAVLVMSRDERTARRWLAGDVMPPAVREWLDRIESVTDGREYITIRLRL